MKKKQWIVLSILSGLLLGFSWYPVGTPFLIFIAFIPLFILGGLLESDKSKPAFWYGMICSWPAFLLWNSITLWWIWTGSPIGAITAIGLNSLLMAIVFGFWQFFKRHNPHSWHSPLFFIALWCCFEFMHLHWELSWPWLNLGNVFAPVTRLVQWYEYTGTFGGSVWILAVNFMGYCLLHFIKIHKRLSIGYTAGFLLCLFIPVLASLFLYSRYQPERKTPIEAVIVQQNTDPWNEQYVLSNTAQTIRLIDVASPCLTSSTELMVCPESAIASSVSLHSLFEKNYPKDHDHFKGFVMFDSLIGIFPQLNIITGVSTFGIFDQKLRHSVKPRAPGVFVELYTSAACINRNGVSDIIHKSKLVPGVEMIPFPALFAPLEKFMVDLGGPKGSYGIDTSQRAFQTTIQDGKVKIGTTICYESVYGEYFSRFVKDGAQLMSIITNDTWWGNTPEYKQHFVFARLRAVETRRTVIRSANNGISGFIDEKGNILAQSNHNERTAIKGTVYPNDKITFYVKHGDYLARIAMGLTILFLIYILWHLGMKKRNRITKK